MAPILVTGGTGTLGRVVVARLVASDAEVRVLSRRPRPRRDIPFTWWTGDLRRGHGVPAAVAGASTVVHCASGRDDVGAARHLVEAAVQADVDHVVYISIVGVDRVPFAYYRSKAAVERLLLDSPLGCTVLRTTQFHDLVARACRALATIPLVLPVPAATSFQPIDVTEVAGRLVELARGEPLGRVADMGGPEVLTAATLAGAYLASVGRRRRVVAVPFPGRIAAAYRRGAHLAPDAPAGGLRFEEWLAAAPGRAQYGRGEGDAGR